MEHRPTVTKSVDQVRALMEDLLATAGCSPERAAVVANAFLEADLRGIGIQGLDHIHTIIRALRGGRIKPDAEPRIVREGPAFLLVDGCGGLGQYACMFTIELAIRKAKESGSCVAGLVGASDLFMLGYYVEQIARAGLVGIMCTSCSYAPWVHPYGGMERMLGTNPIAFGIPTAGTHPMIFDMATSVRAGSRIRHAAYHGEQVPEGYGIGLDGYPTKDPSEIMKGAISPFGGAKGYGLSLTIALLCGPLIGAKIGKALLDLKGNGPVEARLGHFFFAINPDCFGGLEEFKNSVTTFLKEIKESKKAPGFSEIRIPGERAFLHREKALKEGIPILKVTWDKVSELALEMNVTMPD